VDFSRIGTLQTIRTHLKNRILVQDSVFALRLRRDTRGGAEFKTGGILLYVEDFKRDSNPAKDGRPKDIFDIGSTIKPGP
jgi:hypothetical protein